MTGTDNKPTYREVRVKVVNPIYAVGLAWLLYGMFFPLYRFTDWAIAAGVSAFAFLFARRVIPGRKVIAPLTEKGVPDERCMQLIAKGYEYIAELERYPALVRDKAMAAQINEIIQVSRQIFDFTAKNPREAAELRSFVDYYFPATLKLLNTYADMRNQAVKSENIYEIMAKVGTVMAQIVSAFRKQLDDMYADKRLDVKTDIEVLKSVLTSEGLGE